MSSWNISWPQTCPCPCPMPMCISYVEHNGWPPFHELLVMAFNTLTNFYKCYHFLGFWQCIPPAPCTVSHRYKYFWPSSHCQPSLDAGSRFCMGWGQRERETATWYILSRVSPGWGSHQHRDMVALHHHLADSWSYLKYCWDNITLVSSTFRGEICRERFSEMMDRRKKAQR